MSFAAGGAMYVQASLCLPAPLQENYTQGPVHIPSAAIPQYCCNAGLIQAVVAACTPQTCVLAGA